MYLGTRSGIGEHLGADASSGARPDDDGVVAFRGTVQDDFGQWVGLDRKHVFWQERETGFEQ